MYIYVNEDAEESRLRMIQTLAPNSFDHSSAALMLLSLLVVELLSFASSYFVVLPLPLQSELDFELESSSSSLLESSIPEF